MVIYPERKRLRHPTNLPTNNVSFSLSESFLSHRNEAHKKIKQQQTNKKLLCNSTAYTINEKNYLPYLTLLLKHTTEWRKKKFHNFLFYVQFSAFFYLKKKNEEKLKLDKVFVIISLKLRDFQQLRRTQKKKV